MEIRRDTAGDRVISVREVCELIGKRRITLWRWGRDGLFPPAVRLGKRCVGWREADVVQWLKERQS